MGFLREVGRDDIDETFVETFGLSIADTEPGWRSAPRAYYLGEPCREIVTLGPEGLDLEQTIACDLEDSLGPNADGRMWSSRGTCFVLDEPTTVRLSVDAQDGGASIGALECDPDPTGEAELYGYNLTPLETTVTLGACRWRLIRHVETAGTSVRVRIEPQ